MTPMKTIEYTSIVNSVAKLCMQANYNLPADVLSSLESAANNETNELARSILEKCLLNADIAKKEQVPICQDTGFAVFFVEIGDGVRINGGSLKNAIMEGTAKGYQQGYLRKSIVKDPLFSRQNTTDNTPPVIHFDIVSGDNLTIIFAPKGGGSENMSAITMLKPSEGEQGVIDFVTNSVVKAAGNPCPPTIIGVGIGGTFEKCAFLAKKALLRTVGEPNPDIHYAKLEKKILERVNQSGVGPQGLGGLTTALAVHVETFPCHIASLPVAVNLNCHVARHHSITL